MSAIAPSFSQIKAQVKAIRAKYAEATVVGIHSTARWSGPDRGQLDDKLLLISQCDSPLAVRQALRQPSDEHTIKVIVTPLDDTQLGDDVIVRLAKRRLFQINAWQIVPTLFQAHAVDPRLSQQAWIADLLIEHVPAEGYPPARGGFLDVDSVWPVLLKRLAGFVSDSPDLNALLRWSLEHEQLIRFRQTTPQFQDGAINWLVEKAGGVAELILRAILHSNRSDAIALGLVAGVLFHPDTAGKLEREGGRFESRYLNTQSPDRHQMLRWSAAASEVTRTLRHADPKVHRQILARTDEILTDLQADPWAHVSDISELGFNQRLQHFARLLSDIIDRQAWGEASQLRAAQEIIQRHDFAVRENPRLSRLSMAIRLVRWLAIGIKTYIPHPDGRGSEHSKPASLAEAADRQLREGGFVDWARLSLRSGDPLRELSEAYASLFNVVTQVREEHAQTFATLLADWTTTGSKSDDIVPVERILEEFIAPLAAKHPLLVLVIDGMSAAVCHELLADLTRRDWTALSEPERLFNRTGLATIPSVTEYSRTSLLCGRLRQGTTQHEVAEFESHPALLKVSRANAAPKLFHKGDLREGDDAIVSKEVRDAIQSSHRKIVGVVINAVDDHLTKGEQIDVNWTRDAIKVLPALLQEAQLAQRLVVLLSDHGHVLDTGTVERKADGGERWRFPTGDSGEKELHVRGSRVLCDGQQLIAPWSERIRYSSKKNGYHGGLSPQEMVVPIVVLSCSDVIPDGWSEQPIATPQWWDEDRSHSLRPAPPPVLMPQKVKSSGKLFAVAADGDVVPATLAATKVMTDATTPEWITRLLNSPVYEQQKSYGGRAVPTNSEMAQFLTVLNDRGGKLIASALARALQLPPLRLPGLLAKMQRLLNVDGYAVLQRDEASDTIELNRELLLTQFDLSDV